MVFIEKGVGNTSSNVGVAYMSPMREVVSVPRDILPLLVIQKQNLTNHNNRK